jgi:hypothetical protein
MAAVVPCDQRRSDGPWRMVVVLCRLALFALRLLLHLRKHPLCGRRGSSLGLHAEGLLPH